MKITVLAENTSKKENIGCEHGLSLLIETEKHIILFDMGQSELFAENAEKLGIDLGNVDIAVLSHGHYDHGGGLKKFLELNSKAPVFINRYAFEPHFNAEKKYIGLDTELQYSERLVFTDEEYLIDKGLTLFSCYELSKRSDAPSAGLYEMKNGVYIPDDFRHEHYLLIEENDKRILISGCSHKGIMSITEEFQPDILVGGFHFMKITSKDIVSAYAQQLNLFPTEFYTCHCTGREQFCIMQPFMNNLHYISSGQIITI